MSDRTPQADVPDASARTRTTGGGAAATAPKQVNTAFWLYIACAVLSLVGMIIVLASMGSMTTRLQQSGQVSGGTASAAVGIGVTLNVIFGILFIAAYVLFAVFMRRGANWARIVLLIVTVLSLPGILGGYGIGALQVVLGVIATILVFIKPASEYFRSGRAPRA
ncbi:hypothetical protein [Leifsonia sp. EB34]|uniref:hypothetical protein n=1 Tax=Leifsonia sp. EB34 TaxID=3156303 RepID=UPI003519374D